MKCFHSYGGLGNQMFIYAFARQLKYIKKESYCLSKLGKLNYFELSEEDKKYNWTKFIYCKVKNKLFNKAPRYFLKDQWLNHYEDVLRLEKNIVLDGYFQGEQYFQDVKDELRKLFKIKSEYRNEFNKLFEDKFKEKTLAIHIRRTDYQNSFQNLGIGDGSFVLPIDYYYQAMRQIPDLSDYKIICLSDDINFVKDAFKDLKNVFFSEFDEIIDLQILINADVLIAANSSFSWWGAWLNEKPHKKVFMPKYYLGYKVNKMFPIGIIPQEWTQVEFKSSDIL